MSPPKFTHNLFSCQLACRQCEEISKSTDEQCRNRTCFGVPLCWIHLLHKKNLRIKQSTIKGAGKGLFALDKSRARGALIFRKRQYIIDYIGEQITQQELDNRYGRDNVAPYALCDSNSSKDKCIDSACVRGIASMINHNVGKNSNVMFTSSPRGGQFRVIATKNIYNGEEIFVNYGSEYWK